MAKGIDTNSNVYTIVYASVLVILVAFLLAFVSSALKPAQDANVAIDKKSQILAALNVRGLDKKVVEAKFEELIDSTWVMDAEGNVAEGENAFDVDTKELGEKLPLYFARNAAGEEVLVLCLKGRGLWGGLWGYMAITPETGIVKGAYFDHEGETAGLGALIKEEPFQNQFIDRKVGEGMDVKLTVVKKGTATSEFEVDGVTGATLTSKGVAEMVNSTLKAYYAALSRYCSGACEETPATCKGTCNDCPNKCDACKCDSCTQQCDSCQMQCQKQCEKKCNKCNNK